MRSYFIHNRQAGQILVIFAISLLVLLVFIGLAVDGSQLFLNYTRLKRAVDAAAVAAANDFKRGSTLDRMENAALEVLDMHQIDTTTVSIKVYMCDQNGDGVRDASLQSEVPEFYRLCPASGLQKKLIYVRAYENSPTYFVSLLGIGTIPITTTAVAEAAPVDLVIVLDTSESMGRDTPGFTPADFDPATCNAANDCQPLENAKNAAKILIQSLYQGYDRVAIVTFNTQAETRYTLGDPDTAAANIDSLVKLHDDPPVNKLFASWYNAGTNGRYNPVNPDDRDNNGADADPRYSPAADSTVCNITTPNGDRWDASKDIPCDNPDYLDAFDWNQDGQFTSGAPCNVNDPNAPGDDCQSLYWINHKGPLSLVSTCTGCGMRLATDVLEAGGRSNSVWVIVFLSDGLANMSDTPSTFPYDAGTGQGIPSNYPNGFCGGKIDVYGNVSDPATMPNFWESLCVDRDISTRYCIDTNPDTCPPGSFALVGSSYAPPYSPPYSVEDYARDMTDRAALQKSANPKEARGDDIAIYSIGFGDVAALGEPLLRYMAAVGDDGDRTTDPCVATAPRHSCGQYYFAPTASELPAIFEDIASRIYTKISE